MHPYKRLDTQGTPKSSFSGDNSAAKEWLALKYLNTIKNYGAVSHIEFSPIENEFAVTSSALNFYSTSTCEKVKEIAQFQKTPFCGTYRKDGKLIAVGGEFPVVQLFQIETSIALRALPGHTAPVRVVCFSPYEATKIVTGSDDKTIRTWEINTGDPLSILHGHEDSVRALTPSHSENVWITGSYDHTIKVWDLRAKQCVRNFVHHDPIESLVLLQGNQIASAGGSVIKIWDFGTSSSEIEKIEHHQKTVTSLVYDSERNFLLSGSLDQLLKIHSLSTKEAVHTIPYNHPIISIAFSKDREKLAVGLSSGLVNLRKKFRSDKVTVTRKMMEHAEQKDMLYPQDAEISSDQKKKISDLVFQPPPHLWEKGADKYLRRFEYRRALNKALETRNPSTITNVITELEHRDGLLIALSGRDINSLFPIVKFISENIHRPAYAPSLIKTISLVTDIYYDKFGLDPKLDRLFTNIAGVLRLEKNFLASAYLLLGNIQLLLDNANQGLIKEPPSES